MLVMNELIDSIKRLYPEYICLFKIGSFYCAYNKDAYIMSYIFKYKIRDKKDEKECGFPIGSIDKIKARLEQEKINYVLVETKNGANITEKVDLEENNKYNEFYVRARSYVNYKLRIDNVYKLLLDIIDEKDFRKILEKVEEIIYEKKD